jgi:hypothetical protein
MRRMPGFVVVLSVHVADMNNWRVLKLELHPGR